MERHLAGRVGTVDEHEGADRMAGPDQPLDRHDDRRRRGDVIEDHQAGAVGEAGHQRIDDRGAVVFDREGESDLDHASAGAAGLVAGDVLHRIVGLVVDQDLVAGLELDRAENGLGAGGRVVDEDDVVGLGAEIFRELGSSRAHPLGQLAREEIADGALHVLADDVLGGEHRLRRRAVAAVIQMSGAPVERPEVADGLAELGHGGSF